MNLLSVDNFTNLGSPEISDELSVFWLVDVKKSLLVVFELWVVNHFLWDSVSSEEPDSFDIKIGFFTEDGGH